MNNYSFRYPLEYLDKSLFFRLNPMVSSDLEIDGSGESNLYSNICNPKTQLAQNAMSEMSSIYTTDTLYLKQTQKVIDSISAKTCVSESDHFDINDDFCKEFEEIRNEWDSEYFKEKYSYLEWEMVDNLNYSSDFLQAQSFINLSSPLLGLLIPIIFLIFPFILIRIKNIPISFQEYLDTLKEISRHHFIGKLLSVQTMSFENVVYILGMAGLFGLQTYQNVKSCILFYRHTKEMNEHLFTLKKYVTQSKNTINNFVKLHSKKSKYNRFCKKSADVSKVLEKMEGEMACITDFSVSFGKFRQVGYMLKTYYSIYSIPEYRQCLEYSAKFHGYLQCLEGIHENVKLGHLGKTQYYPKCSLRMKNIFYLAHLGEDVVKNDLVLKNNRIITGVNASGKTTFLKTAAINIILSQQFGYGCFSKCKMTPYEYIHSYLNIPDTSGRDSLFQAESRRCKEIIDIIEKNKESRHFCIFDELYSGTNPEEASKSAISFLKYLAKRKNVNFILTTHYLDVCRTLEKDPRIDNYMMCVEKREDGTFQYTYKTESGISNMKGGIEILKNMNYPEEILEELLL